MDGDIEFTYTMPVHRPGKIHPMRPRYEGTINDGQMIHRNGVTANMIAAPTLIMHAKDDALVNFRHAENAHAKIKKSKLILFNTGGHAMLSHMDKVRGHAKAFLEDIQYKDTWGVDHY